MIDQLKDPAAFVGNRLVIDNRVVRIETLAESPRLVVLGGALSGTECEALIADARQRMDRSLLIAPRNVDSTEDATRTSSGMHFEHGASPVADEIQRRLIAIIGMPIEHGEPLQVLRYVPGEEYAPHIDYFDVRVDNDGDGRDDDDGTGASSTVELYGQRIATLICYLSDVESGGNRVPENRTRGVTCPQQGRLFHLRQRWRDGRPDVTSCWSARHRGGEVDRHTVVPRTTVSAGRFIVARADPS